jgi:mRNA interferase MazF
VTATKPPSSQPSRGDIWYIDLSDPPKGHEQAGNRPALIVSVDKFNHGPADLIIAIPISKVPKGIPTHVEVNPPEGGVTIRSFIKCEAVRSLSKIRLVRRMGAVSERTMEAVEDRIRILLGLM